MTRPTALTAQHALPDTDDRQVTPDRIFLRDHVVEAEIGAFQAERGITQRIAFTLVADLLPAQRQPVSPHGPRDDVDTILSYDVLLDSIRDEIGDRRINLLETLAEGIAARVLAHVGVTRLRIVIEKLDRVPGALGVDITRERPRAAVIDPAPAALPDTARIALIARDRLAASDLADWVLALAADGPLILCVDAPGARAGVDLPAPVQRRVDLLAFEQAAWRLAARDPRFVVVDSRTELDWGLRNGQVSVWAPCKMVVDARDEAPTGPVCMTSLVPWLARRLGIRRIDTLGAVTPADSTDLSLRAHD